MRIHLASVIVLCVASFLTGGAVADETPDSAKVSVQASPQGKQRLRWRLSFDSKDGRDYLKQLTTLKAMIALPVDGEEGKFILIRDLDKPNVAAVEDLSTVDRICWIDDRSESVRSVLSALPKNAKTQKAAFIITYFPIELEKKLAKLERNAAKKNPKFRDEDQILETNFKVVPSKAGGYDVEVKDVRLK